MNLFIIQESGDSCDDTLSIHAIRDGQEHLLNTLHHDNNALIMVEDVHVQMVFRSCDRTNLQTAHGFMAKVTYQGMFNTLMIYDSTEWDIPPLSLAESHAQGKQMRYIDMMIQ